MEREMKAPLTREAVESIRFHRQHWPESTAWAQEQLLALCDSHELLRARLDAAEQRWQPIETAPKDGTHILLFMPRNPTSNITVEEGWYLETVDGVDYWSTPYRVTHWMPLPKGPQ